MMKLVQNTATTLAPSQRRHEILATLSAKNSAIPISSLAVRFSVTTRTIKSDLAALKQAGHEIESIRGRSGGVFIRNGSGSPPSRLAPIATPERLSLVGREVDIERIHRALWTGNVGRGRVVTITGEPGIGKSAMADEMSHRLRTMGTLVLRGWCSELMAIPGSLPWVQIITECFRSEQYRQVSGQLVSEADEIQKHLPAGVNASGQSQESSIGQTPANDVNSVRRRLLESTTSLLHAVSGIVPVAILIEDIHWADNLTLELIRFLAAAPSDAPLRILLTARSHSDPERWQQLLSPPTGTVVALNPLDDEDVRRLVELDNPLGNEVGLNDLAIERSEGNPLFALLYSDFLRASVGTRRRGGSPISDLPLEPPASIQSVILHRVEALSQGSLELLGTAATIGLEFGLDRLASATGIESVERILSLMSEPVQAGVVREEFGHPGRYRFAHGLIRDTLHSRLTTAERVELHHRLYGQLDRERGSGRDISEAEIVYHAIHAEPLLDGERVARRMYMAAIEAMNSLNYSGAVDHLIGALERLEGPSELRGDVYHSLALAQLGAPEAYARSSTLTDAFDSYLAAGRYDKALEMASRPYFLYSDDLFDVCSRALELAKPGSAHEGWIRGQRGAFLGQHFDKPREGLEENNRALKIALDLEDDQLELWTRGRRIIVLLASGQSKEALATGRRVLSMNVSRDPHPETNAAYWATQSAISLGELSEAKRLAGIGARAAVRSGHRFRTDQGRHANSCVAFAAGELENSLAVLEPTERFPGTREPDPINIAMEALLAFELSEVGIMDQHLASLASLLQAQQTSPQANIRVAIPGITLAKLASRSGERSHAELAIEDLPEIGHRSPSHPITQNQCVKLVAWAQCWILLGETDRATDLYRDLVSARKQLGDEVPVLIGGYTFSTGFDRVLGTMAWKLGEIGAAAAHFDRALGFASTSGFRLEHALTCLEYGAFLQDQRSERSVSKALNIAEKGIAVATEASLPRLQIELRTLHAELASERPTQPFGLSDREIEVVDLIALGRSNREVARSLTISEPTVASHVRSILRKTDTQNRTEAARAYMNASSPSD